MVNGIYGGSGFVCDIIVLQEKYCTHLTVLSVTMVWLLEILLRKPARLTTIRSLCTFIADVDFEQAISGL